MVKRGAVGERFDADYQRLINSTIFNFKFPLRTVETMFSIKDGDHNKLPEEEISDISNGIRYLRVQDLKEGQIISENPIYISKRYYNSITRSHIKSGYILFSIMASVGSVAVFPENLEDCTANRAVGILIPKSKNIDSYYFQAFCNTTIGYKLFETLKKGGVQQRINLSDIAKLKIPVPPLEIQSQIVNIFNTAYVEKRQKETEAKELLASIDAYLLEQLGIVLPDKIEEKNVFYVPFSKVQGKRFDPKPYVSVNQALYESLSNSKYQKESLKNLLIQSVAGDWGIEENKEGFEERLVIRATEFDNLYNLNLENSRVKYRFINQVKLGKMDLQVGDLLIEKSGGSENQPVGRIALITKDIANQYKLAYSNFIHKIRVSDQINPEYLFYFLKTIHNIKITDLMQSQTNGIRNLIMREYFNIPVSLPPLEIQTEIANYIRNIRERAKTLENEAKEVIEKAKAEVEKIILGE